MIFKRGNGEKESVAVFAIDSISESRSWSRPGMQGIESSSPLYLSHDNASILSSRQQKGENGFHHILTADKMAESSFVSNKTAEISSQFPLYLYSEDGRKANFANERLEELFSDVEQPNRDSKTVYPEDIVDYIYASLHSPSYRSRFATYLKSDFPRIPRPKSWSEFWRLVKFGNELRNLHLMKSSVIDDYDTTYPIAGDDMVEKITREGDKVFINRTQYFGNVPDIAWNFYIGGYQPTQKWLKDRKGRKLSSDNLDHYQRIIKILLETDLIMKEIG